MRAEVELHSTSATAVEAVRDTIAHLSGGGILRQEGAHWYLYASDFVVFACENQGYVKRVIKRERD